MILSTAGSGKTLVLTNRVIRIAKQLRLQKCSNQRILCLCFNQAMADEMHYRIAEMLVHENLSADIYVTRTAFTITRTVTIEVRTFHGLGRYILNTATTTQRELVSVPPDYLNVLQGRPLKKAFYDALKSSGRLPPDATEKSARLKISTLLASVQGIKGKEFDKECENILLRGSKLNDNNASKRYNLPEFDIYENYLFNSGATDYGDMLWKSVRLLLKCDATRKRLRTRYVSVLVDEFQDVSASQLIFCKALVEDSQSLTLVGDDDQQIYSWRASNHWFCHQAALKVFPNLTTLTLPENRRCPASVVRAAFSVISNNSDRAPKTIEPVRPDGASVRIVGCNTLDLEKEFVVKAVRKVMKATRSTGERILILFRINKLLLEFENTLNDHGIWTTRSIRPKANESVIGSITLNTLALVTLIAPGVDLETFVWAATTLSPKLDEDTIHDVLTEEEKKENEASQSANGKRSHGHIAKGMASRYLERLTSWFTCRDRGDDEVDEERVEPMYSLLENTDALLLKMCDLKLVQDVVKHATSILSNCVEVGSQQSVEDEMADDFKTKKSSNERAGYDVLIRAAKRVDARSKNRESKERKRQPHRRVRIVPVAEVAPESAGSDLEDFSELFSSDVKMTSKKRRKAQGIGATEAGNEELLRRVTSLGDDMDEFCNSVRMKLGDYSDGRLKGSDRGEKQGEPNVVLSTVHNAKGSTFEYVFLCGVNKYDFPNGVLVRNSGNPCLDIVAEGVLGDRNGWHCQEERRVFFVALTRTVTQFTCTYSGDGRCRTTPKEYESLFIKELLGGLVGNEKEDAVESFISNADDLNGIFKGNTNASSSKHRPSKKEDHLQ